MKLMIALDTEAALAGLRGPLLKLKHWLWLGVKWAAALLCFYLLLSILLVVVTGRRL